MKYEKETKLIIIFCYSLSAILCNEKVALYCVKLIMLN